MVKVALNMFIGVAVAYNLPIAISLKLLAALNIIFAALCYKYKKNYLFSLMALLVGFSWMHYNLASYNSKLLTKELYNKRINIIATVTTIPEIYASKIKFVAKIDEAKLQPNLIDARILLTGYKKAMRHKPRIGDKLAIEAKLKPPHGFNNPGSFNVKRHMLTQRIVATGRITAPNKVQLIENKVPLYNLHAKARENLSNSISNVIGQREMAAVIKGLLIGERAGIPYKYWQSLQNTGLAHLFAISGLHIGLVALFGVGLARGLYLIKPVNWLRVELPICEAIFAITLGGLYSALSGFALPTLRAVVMIAIVATARILKRNVTATNSLMCALIAILLLDPISILTISFWLTFVSMGVVLYISEQNSITGVKGFLKFNLYISLALFPITLFFFHKVSLIAPIMNTIALPLIGYVVLPMVFLGIFVEQFWEYAGFILDKFISFVEYCANFKFATVTNFSASSLSLGLAFVGVLLMLSPKKLRLKKTLIIICLLPLILPIKNQLAPNTVKITALDVGQGTAVYIKTQNHSMLYDTGPKYTKYTDAGNTVIVPYLRTQAINKLDKIVVSHPDLDHIGGARSIMRNLTVDEVLISKRDRRLPGATLCYGGQSWQWDGVLFEMLHPIKNRHYAKKNDSSCVLKVTAGTKSLLLTGDIEKRIETKLVKKYKDKLKADILLVPHHGSSSSSTNKFIKAVNPEYAIVTSGFLNRYGHPKSRVLERYRRHGVKVLATVDTGAIDFILPGK